MNQFKMKYEITRDYIRFGNARSGQKLLTVDFIVSHDIGNGASTAYQNRSHFHNNQPKASAQTFIDDKYILEIIPLDEKAWHVMYNTPIDNQLFGKDANDAAIGIELCHGGSINFQEAYKRYVWYHAYLCWKFNKNPRQHIVSHKTLDPNRRTDPDNAFNRYGITFEQFIEDVVNELEDCLGGDKVKFTNDWQWDLLGKALHELYEKSVNGEFGDNPLLTDYNWANQAFSREMKVDDLCWLTLILLAKDKGIKL